MSALSEVLYELSAATLEVERKRGDVGIVHTLSFLGPDHIITI